MAELEGRALDRYELRHIIGKGGMASVYEAYDPSFQRLVAIKVFRRDEGDMLRRFMREARVMASLNHPHLVHIYDSGEAQIDGVSRSYIVMPKMTGGTLRARIRHESLSLNEVCRCLSDIAGVLDYIHSKGIIHRDIKASNVLLDDEGRCYLTDFGIARIVEDATQLTTTGAVLGTVEYVAPELFEVHRRADARSDLYSLGVLLYEMVTGRLPFSADNQLALLAMHASKQPPSPRQYVPLLSSQVEHVMYKALEKQPEKRYDSASALAGAFCRAVNANDAGPVLKQADLDASTVNMGELVAATEAATPGARPAQRDAGNANYVNAPPASLVLPGPEPMTQTQPPLAIRAPQRPRHLLSQRTLIVAMISLAILLVLAVPVTYALLRMSTETGPGGGQAAATATATPGLSAADVQATATAAPLATATSGQPTYQDTLTDANNSATQAADWDQNDQCSFANDGYHIQQSAAFPFFKGCREQNNPYLNLALSVNMNLLSGNSGGVFFRLNTNFIGNYDGYLFEVDSQGRYKISQEQGATITPLQDWTAAPALHAGYHIQNLLQLIVRGDTFLFYANGHFLSQVRDGYYNQSGTIGFLATSVAGGSDAEVVYSDLNVHALA